jgi:peptide deformylase
VYNLVVHPSEVLRRKSRDVDSSEGELVQEILSKMQEAVSVEGGVAIAAPQIGYNLNIILVHYINDPSDPDHRMEPFESHRREVFINPKIVFKGKKIITGTEGCLSIPSRKSDVVPRHFDIKIDYMDKDFNPRKLRANKFFARVLQHEIDHLNGILFIDLIKPEDVIDA